MNKNKPLISFIVSCYNQEAFIREAVEGAFAQTYSPMEIIISDDCSSDGTFDVVQAMAAEYQGPHTVRINRNATNLGIGGNVNRLMELSRGELIVLADGDDISLPSRTEVMVQAWEDCGRKPTSICSCYTTISEDGTEQGPGGLRGSADDPATYRELRGDLGEFMATRRPTICGCAHAWTPELFRYFGPLRADLEDLVLSFRSLAIGQMIYVHQPLVKYRRHGSNVSFFADERDRLSFARRENRLRWVDEQTVRAYDNMLADLDLLQARGRMTPEEVARLKREALRVRTLYAIERMLMEGGFFKRWFTLAGAVFRGNLRCALRLTPRLLPLAIYRSLFLLRARVRGAFQPAHAAVSSKVATVSSKVAAAGLLAGEVADLIIFY